MMTPAEQNALRIELKKLEEKIELMRQLGTTEGFYKYYFSKLKQFDTYTSCFWHVNNLYLELFGKERFVSWDSFRNALKYNDQKK